MGTSAERSSSNTEYFTRGDKIPGLQVRFVLFSSVSHEANSIIVYRLMEWISLQQSALSNSLGNGQLMTKGVPFYLNSLHIVMEDTRTFFLFHLFFHDLIT